MKNETLEKLKKAEYLTPELIEKLLIRKTRYEKKIGLINELLKKKVKGRDK